MTEIQTLKHLEERVRENYWEVWAEVIVLLSTTAQGQWHNVDATNFCDAMLAFGSAVREHQTELLKEITKMTTPPKPKSTRPELPGLMSHFQVLLDSRSSEAEQKAALDGIEVILSQVTCTGQVTGQVTPGQQEVEALKLETIAALEKRCALQLETIRELRADLAESDAGYDERERAAESRTKEARAEIDRLTREVDAKCGVIDALNVEIKALRQKVDYESAEFYRAEMVNMNEMNDAIIAELEGQIESLKAQRSTWIEHGATMARDMIAGWIAQRQATYQDPRAVVSQAAVRIELQTVLHNVTRFSLETLLKGGSK